MDQNAKQLAVERLKQSSNVLITVGANPSVDALASAIGFSLLLGRLEKHVSAVFSGQVPPAIEFLEPNKRLSKDVSSLRDFIIALDKDKADKLRYKVEDNVVKIFITPYRTSISQADLNFSQGDFNVDVVVALGVTNQDDLDNAIKTNGRILHDAAVITLNAGSQVSSLGAINWQDPAASSLSEMLVSISESFGSGLLDPQMATAFLTGIVAATERFSNPKTSPKVMTMAAQLMAAGANQQLIASNLAPTLAAIPPKPPQPPENADQIKINHDERSLSPPPPPLPFPPVQPTPPVQLQPPAPVPIAPPPIPEPAPPPLAPPPPPVIEPISPPTIIQPPVPEAPILPPANNEKSLSQLEDEISSLASSPKPKAEDSTLSLPTPVKPPSQSGGPKPIMDSYTADGSMPQIGRSHGHGPRDVDEDPTLGGTFNATSEKAHDESVSDLRKNRNNKLLSHPGKALDAKAEPPERPSGKAHDLTPLNLPQSEQFVSPPPPMSEPVPPPPIVSQPMSQLPPHPVTAMPPAEQAIDVEAARAAVEAAFNSQPFDPAHQPTDSIGSVPLPNATLNPAEPEAPIAPPNQFKIP